MSDLVRCLACGHVFDRALEMCPRRYLSPHNEKAMIEAAEWWSRQQGEVKDDGTRTRRADLQGKDR